MLAAGVIHHGLAHTAPSRGVPTPTPCDRPRTAPQITLFGCSRGFPSPVPDRQRDTSVSAIVSQRTLCGGGLRLIEYRAYTVGLDGRFIGFKALVCADDAEATDQVKHLVDGYDVELWSGDRFITRLGHKPEQKLTT
jgi:hypothetical protein